MKKVSSKLFFFAIICTITLLTFIGCSQTTATAKKTSGKPKIIAFSSYTQEFLHLQAIDRGVKKSVAALGSDYEYVLHDQKNDETEMVTGAQNLLNQGVAALLISPCKPDAVGPVVQLGKEKGIPVIIIDIGTGNTDYDAFIVSNNYEGGR